MSQTPGRTQLETAHTGTARQFPTLTVAIRTTCEVCNIPSINACTECNAVFYCNTEHQQQDWERHSLACASASQNVSNTNDIDLNVGAWQNFGPSIASVGPSRSPSMSQGSNINSNPIIDDIPLDIRTQLTLGSTFEIDAFLFPSDGFGPRTVKMDVDVVFDLEGYCVKHDRTRGRNKLGVLAGRPSFFLDTPLGADGKFRVVYNDQSTLTKANFNQSLRILSNGKLKEGNGWRGNVLAYKIRKDNPKLVTNASRDDLKELVNFLCTIPPQYYNR